MSTDLDSVNRFALPGPLPWETYLGYSHELGVSFDQTDNIFKVKLSYLAQNAFSIINIDAPKDPKIAQLSRLVNQAVNSNPTNFGRILRTKQAKEFLPYLKLRQDIIVKILTSKGQGQSWQEAIDAAWAPLKTRVMFDKQKRRSIAALWDLVTIRKE